MLVLIHVAIALASLVQAGLLLLSPSKNKFRLSYGLTGATVASGTYLVVSTRQPMLSSCVTGLTYIGVILSLVFIAHRRQKRIST